MLPLAALCFLAVLLAVGIAKWRWRSFSYFKMLGIPGPKPNIFHGNLLEYHETDHFKVIGKWLQTYGDTFGFYNGDVPFIVTKDINFLEYVFVRNHEKFTDRGVTMATKQGHPFLQNSIFHAEGQKWQSLRKAMCPIFAPENLKQMMAILKTSTDTFLGVVNGFVESGRQAHVYRLYYRFAIDYFGRAVFGMDNNLQEGPERTMPKEATEMLQGKISGTLSSIGQSTTMLGVILKPLYWIIMLRGPNIPEELAKEPTEVIQLRRKDPESRKQDVLQNLLDAEYEEDVSDTQADIAPSVTDIKGNRSLTTDEILLEAITLFSSGYETTAAALSYITYVLASNQQVQEKVREEVNAALAYEADFDFETLVEKLPYLHQVINEVLRLYPPVLTFTTRKALEDFEYGGSKYKAGTCVMSPTLQIHTDPRRWQDPLNFRPDRFSPENKKNIPKMAYQPFGLGPRKCLGMPMAELMLTYVTARLVQEFYVDLGRSQEGSLELRSCGMGSAPAVGPWIGFRRV